MFLSITNLKNKIKKYLKLMAISSVFVFFWWITLAGDLLFETIKDAKQEMIYPWQSRDSVWNEVFRGEKQVSIDGGGFETKSIPDLVAKVTRLLLMLVITLSVTMILYNGIKYIVETWQWKDSKSLMKNVVYIVVWILVSLFSIIIITLLRSVPTTIDGEGWVNQTTNNATDRESWIF